MTWSANYKPIDPNKKLIVDQGETFSYPKRYKRMVRKLIYLGITRHDISYVVEVVSQFMQNPHIDPCKILKKALAQGVLYEYKEILKL